MGRVHAFVRRLINRRADDTRLIAESEALNARQAQLVTATSRLLRDTAPTIEQMMNDVVAANRRTEGRDVRRMD